MKHVINLDSEVINDATDVEELERNLPDGRMQNYIDYAQEQKQMQKEIGTLGRLDNEMGWTQRRSMKRVAAGIPMPILGAIAQIDPEFARGRGLGREKFYRWLEGKPWNVQGKVGA